MHEILTKRDKRFGAVVTALLLLLSLLILYPLYFVVIASFSDPQLIATGKVLLLPKGLNVDGYEAIFQDESVLTGYLNSLYYAALGSAVTLAATLCAAFPLAKRDFRGRRVIMLLFTVTMFFNGGMIPTYLVIQKMGLLNSVWALVLPGAVTAYNVLITRTFITTSIPEEMSEAAAIDGCGHALYFIRILTPLSAPIIAVLVLFSAVGHWNSYMPPLLYISDKAKYPLQLVLRAILVQNSASDAMMMDNDSYVEMAKLAEKVKYALIIVASVPVLALYPFLQRYLVKGMMVGSVKG